MEVNGDDDQQEGREQQPQETVVHRGVLNGIAAHIAHLTNPNNHREEEDRHNLTVIGCFMPPIDRHSSEHLVNFLD
jgi:hypothetical protein